MAALRLALTPGLLLAAALVIHARLDDHHRVARALAAAATLAAPAVLFSDSAPIFAGGHLEHLFGEPVPGIPILARADTPGLIVIALAGVAMLTALLDPSRRAQESEALLVCLAGSVLTGLAGNATTLFVGMEVGNLGALLLMTAGRRSLGRGAATACLVEHIAALGLLAAALQLETGRGTSDFSALAGTPLTAAVAAPWALAGAVRVLAPAIAPGAGRPRPNLAWLAVAAAPSGAMVLIRLGQAAGGDLSQTVTVMLAAVGLTAAMVGAMAAARSRLRPGPAGRALCLASGGFVVALAGVGGSAAEEGFAAAFLALQLALMAAPAWNAGSRWTAALALVVAGALPGGFGTTALVLGLGAVAAKGVAGTVLLVGLGGAASVAAVAAVLAAREVLATPDRRPTRLGWDGAPAVALSVVAGLVPGLALTLVVAPLAGESGIRVLDAGSIRGPGGGWSGGYLMVAAVVVLAGIGSALVVGGVAAPRREAGGPTPPPRRRPLLLSRRRAGPVLRRAARVLAQADSWLIPQPQLIWVVAAIAATVLVFR